MGNKGSAPQPQTQQKNNQSMQQTIDRLKQEAKASNDQMMAQRQNSTLSLDKIQASIDGSNNIIKTAFETTIPNVLNSLQNQNFEVQREFQKANLAAMDSMSNNILAGSQRIIDQATEQNLQLNTLQQKIYANSIEEKNSIAGIKNTIDTLVKEAKEDLKLAAMGLVGATLVYYVIH